MELTRENYNETAKELLTFLQNSPSCFHAVKNVVDMLTAAGFTEVKEEESWKLEAGGRYFVTRNQSSVIAFKSQWISSSMITTLCFKQISPIFSSSSFVHTLPTGL